MARCRGRRFRSRRRALQARPVAGRDARKSARLRWGPWPMKPIRIAILGFGKIAEDQHVPSIENNGRFELVATSSRSGHGVAQIFADWRELIRSVDGLQAVAITTPPGPRYDIARECVSAGLHCLLEKPPTAGLAGIADLACLAEAKGVSLFTT